MMKEYFESVKKLAYYFIYRRRNKTWSELDLISTVFIHSIIVIIIVIIIIVITILSRERGPQN